MRKGSDSRPGVLDSASTSRVTDAVRLSWSDLKEVGLDSAVRDGPRLALSDGESSAKTAHHVRTRTLSTSESRGSHVGVAMRGSESMKLVNDRGGSARSRGAVESKVLTTWTNR